MSDDLIDKLINRNADAVRIEELERERDAALAAQSYMYIGKDMKPILARDLEDAKDAAEAKLAKAVEALREIESITVHSGGDINGVKASAWRDAFEQAHCEACAALTELEEKK